MSRYKTFFVQLSKVGFLSVLVVLLLVGAISYSIKNKKAENTYAGTGENVTGFAWSENTGLISFNSANCDTDNDGKSNGGTGCPASGTTMSSYGVNIASDGKLSGYAWSENIGWITFNRDNANTPPSNDPGAGLLSYIDSDGKTVKGWARAMSACDDANSDGKCDASGAGTNSGGWDGWIALSDMSASSLDYGTTLDATIGKFKGFAFGSDVVGWLSFSSANCDSNNDGTTDTGNYSNCTAGQVSKSYAVSTNFELNQAPSVVADSISADYCNGRITFNWTFSDPNISDNLKQQRGYEIKAAYDPNTPSTIISSSSTGSANSTTVLFNDLTTKLGSSWYDKKLKWQITVWDNGVNGSGDQPKSAANTRTESSNLSDREYPVVAFDSNPALDKIHAEQDVQFLDKSTCYSSGDTPAANCSSWSWDIQSAAPSTSTEQNPIVQFAESVQNKTITLIAKDEKGDSCSVSRNINIGLPIPKIEEKK